MPYPKYIMPPEWLPHSHTLLAWPDNRETWPGEQLNRVEHIYADILEALTPHEKVLLLVANEQSQQAASALIQHRNIDWNRILLIRMPVNDVWIRDYGPICLIKKQSENDNVGELTGYASADNTSEVHVSADHSAAKHKSSSYNNEEIVMSNWEYNAWGGKYPPFDSDNAVPGKLAKLLNYPELITDMVLEGGSIDVNGAGCVLTTESVLLNPNRNPGMSKNEIEERLRKFLGVDKIIWLKSGLKGDDTDGHIDDLARFVSPHTIVTTVSGNTNDPNYEILQENLQILQNATDIKGRSFEIIELPLPLTRIMGTTVDGSEHVPASYINFYIANNCVLVPLYDSNYDEKVLKIFCKLFPDRDIRGIRCNDLVWGQGSIHCITQQIPLLP